MADVTKETHTSCESDGSMTGFPSKSIPIPGQDKRCSTATNTVIISNNDADSKRSNNNNNKIYRALKSISTQFEAAVGREK